MDRLAGLGVVTEREETFDDSHIIEVSPTFVYEAEDSIVPSPFRLGALWTSTAPDHALLVLQYRSSTSSTIHSGEDLYTSFERLDVNIDDDIRRFDATRTSLSDSGVNSVSRSIDTESRASVIVPLDYLETMVSAEDVRIRIISSSGYADSLFHIERSAAGSRAAKSAISEFLSRVNDRRKTI